MGGSTSKGFIELTSSPFKYCKITRIKHQFYAIPIYRKDKDVCNEESGIYRYDFKENKWIQVSKYPQDLQIAPRACTYDKSKDTLIISSSDDGDQNLKAIFKIHRVNLSIC